MAKPPYISTGQAARILGVTPDTVLKWVKQGKLTALRTGGGHYRVLREQVENMAQGGQPARGGAIAPEVFCWEYFGKGGPKPECTMCLVKKAKALRCYELTRYPKEAGFHSCFAFKGPCAECPYFQTHRRHSIKLLIVTDQAELRERLAAEAEHTRFRVEFASHAYDCSALVDRFRPSYVVVDCTMPVDTYASLCAHLSSDPRIPGVKILLAVGRRGSAVGTKLPGVVGELRHPFGMADLEKLLPTDAEGADSAEGWAGPALN